MILTRYLYPKNNAEYSLKVALFQGNCEQALFWAYELYFSGFKQQVLQFLKKNLDDYFLSSLRKKKVADYLQKKMDEWRTSRKDAMVATFVENILRCQIDVEQLRQDLPEYAWEEYSRNFAGQTDPPVLFIVYKDSDIQPYKNRPLISTKSWKIPPKVCIYTCLREPGSHAPEMLFDMVVAGEWLFYAAGSPLWKTRIQKYQGIINYDKKMVTFSDEDLEEAFYNLYNLEPDEQPKTVINKWLGISM
jgi:hypothetical protein